MKPELVSMHSRICRWNCEWKSCHWRRALSTYVAAMSISIRFDDGGQSLHIEGWDEDGKSSATKQPIRDSSWKWTAAISRYGYKWPLSRVMSAMGLPKSTDEERRQERNHAGSYEGSVEVPFKVMQASSITSIGQWSKLWWRIANPNSVTDAGVGAL